MLFAKTKYYYKMKIKTTRIDLYSLISNEINSVDNLNLVSTCLHHIFQQNNINYKDLDEKIVDRLEKNSDLDENISLEIGSCSLSEEQLQWRSDKRY